MRAFLLKGFDESPVVDDIPDPVLTAPDEMIVRVQAASLSRLDRYVAEGALRGLLEHVFPVVLGWDFAGAVEQAGASVTGFAAGDPVMGILHRIDLQAGTIAEKVLLTPNPQCLVRRPPELDVVAAAAVPFAAHSAWGCIAVAEPQPGEQVLVVGACGGIGGFAVQFAAATGAYVIAAGCNVDADYLRGLGAAQVLDFHTDLPATLSRRHPDGIDALIDTVSAEGEHDRAAFTAVADQVRSGGRIVSTGMIADTTYYLQRGVHAVNLMSDLDLGCSLDTVTRMLAAGQLQMPPLHVGTLDEAPDLLKRLTAEHTTGKYVVRL